MAASGVTPSLIVESTSNFDVKPFSIDLSHGVKRLKALLSNSILPEEKEFPSAGSGYGIDLHVLRGWRKEWIESYDWNQQQENMNKYMHYTVMIEGLKIHFVHEKSKDKNAIPIILLHGWPGTFNEFLPVVNSLTQSALTSTGKSVSFNVVVPSLPGFTFSSSPPEGWTIDDTARVFNTLMTEVLGYSTYAVHGTDWGGGVAYSLYKSYKTTVRAGHFVFIPFFPPSQDVLAAEGITLTPIGETGVKLTADWVVSGSAYFHQQTSQPNTIGYALYDNPIGQLSWIGHKYLLWSDPNFGTPPSRLTSTDILTTVSLYFLTQSFISSVYTYAQNRNGFSVVYTKPETDAPMLFSSFQYYVGYWPKEFVQRVGNLVYYKEHERGGHFPALDNPAALVEDLREIGEYFVGR